MNRPSYEQNYTGASSNYSHNYNSNSNNNATTNKPKRPPILPNDIKCVLLQGYGSIKQLQSISIPRPTPVDGEVLIHVRSWYVFKKK